MASTNKPLWDSTALMAYTKLRNFNFKHMIDAGCRSILIDVAESIISSSDLVDTKIHATKTTDLIDSIGLTLFHKPCPALCPMSTIFIILSSEKIIVRVNGIQHHFFLIDPDSFGATKDILNKWYSFVEDRDHLARHHYLY